MSDCVIDVGHPEGVFATWVNDDNPELIACDHHKKQYDTHTLYYDSTWRPILRNGEKMSSIVVPEPYRKEILESVENSLQHLMKLHT